MIGKAKTLKVFPLKSEFLALLKEAELIRKLKPKYNISLKDDKTPSYIAILNNKDIPKVAVVRQNHLNQYREAEIFGPFLSSGALRTVLKIARRIFPYCDRPTSHKACFYYHLNLCPGICIGKISSGNYKQQINRLILFLRGDHQKLLRQLSLEMKRKSKVLDFESASKIRDQIYATNNLNTVNAFGEFSTLSDVIARSPGQIGTTRQSIKDRFPRSLSFARNDKGIRIEGYDISHLQGKWATASMVVFLGGKPAKEEYRQFRVESPPSSDDPGMLSETLARRFLHPEWNFPDLIMIDGGEPQVRGISKYFKNLPVKLPKMVGLVKGEETIIVPENKEYKRLNLPKSDPFLKILMAIRDESHRFARRYHHKLRLKSLIG